MGVRSSPPADVDYVHIFGNWDVEASVVIVTFDTPEIDFRTSLSRLESEWDETDALFEVVVVNNGVNWDIETIASEFASISTLVQMVGNQGITRARNIGADAAQGNLLIFLDDDAVPAYDFVQSHVEVHEMNDIIACRGRVLPRTDTVLNSLQQHYNPGDEPMPFALNIEGNTSIEADAFKAVGGFSEALSGRPGHQGPFLHFKLHRTGYLPSDIIYHPEPVIYHDYEDGVLKYLKKTWTFNRTGELIRSMYPGFAQFSDRTPATTESDFTPQPENIPRKVMTFLLRFTVHVIVSVQDWFTSVDTESLPKRYFLRDGTSIELDDVYDDIWKEDGQLRALKDDQMYRLRITEDGIEEIHLGTVDREILPDHLKESGVS